MPLTTELRRPVIERVGPVKRGTKTSETAVYAIIEF